MQADKISSPSTEMHKDSESRPEQLFSQFETRSALVVPEWWEVKPILGFCVSPGTRQQPRQETVCTTSVKIEKFGGSINIRNTYTLDDLDGFPLQFKYKAANCRLFYTKDMIQDITATWNRVAGIAFRGAPCAPGSTVNKNGTIGFETPGFTKDVKSRVRGLPVPTIPNRG